MKSLQLSTLIKYNLYQLTSLNSNVFYGRKRGCREWIFTFLVELWTKREDRKWIFTFFVELWTKKRAAESESLHFFWVELWTKRGWLTRVNLYIFCRNFVICLYSCLAKKIINILWFNGETQNVDIQRQFRSLYFFRGKINVLWCKREIYKVKPPRYNGNIVESGAKHHNPTN